MPTMTHLRAVAIVLAVASAICAPLAWAQGSGPAPGAAEAPAEEAVRTAAVMVDGVALFRVRGVSALPAEERARLISDRIVSVAGNPAVSLDSLRIEETDLASRIVADRQLVMGVHDADGQVEGVQRHVLALTYVDRVRTAIVAYRAERTAAAIQRAGVRAVTAGAIAVVLVLAVFWMWRRLDRAIESRFRRRVEALTAKSHDVMSATSVWTSVRHALRFVRTVILAAVGFLAVEYVLALFPQTRPTAWNLGRWVLDPLTTMWTAFAATIPSLIFLAILFFLVRIVLTIIRRFFDAIAQRRIRLGQFEPEWATPTYRLVRLLAIAFAIVVGYPYIPGSSSEAFKGISLFLGVVFSLGSSSFLANIIAGYSMNYRRLFKVGDRVKVGEVVGEVTAIRLQITHLRTIRNEEVTIPNSVILNTHVVNYSALARERGLILAATVGIGYETPWRQVEAMLLEAARRTPRVRQDPPPFIRQQALGDFAVTYALCVHTDEPLKMEATYTDLHRNILDVFNEFGVQIMTPAYEGDPEIPKIVPRDQWYMAPAKPAHPADLQER